MVENKQKNLLKLSRCRSFKDLSAEKIQALRALERKTQNSTLSEKEIEEFAIMHGRKINKAVARRLKTS